MIKVLANQQQAFPPRQAGIGAAMHGGVRSGFEGPTSSSSGLSPHWPLTNLLRPNT